MSSRHATAFFALLFALSASADVRVALGPEVPLALPSLELQAAAFEQTRPVIASSGRDFLAVWMDGRNGGDDHAIYAARLDSEGRPFPLTGRRIASYGRTPLVASDGIDFLIVWMGQGATYAQRVDRDANPIGPPQFVEGPAIEDLFSLWSNGSDYLLSGSYSAAIVLPWGKLLDRDGAPITRVPFGYQLMMPTVRERQYSNLYWKGVLDARGDWTGETLLVEQLISSSGFVTSRTELALFDRNHSIEAATSAPGRVLASGTTKDSRSWVALVDRATGEVRERTIEAEAKLIPRAVLWDGREFALLLYRYPNLIYAVRVSGDGIPGPATLLADRATWHPAIASDGRTRLVVWSDARSDPGDLVVRIGYDFSTGITRTAAFSGHAQIGANLAFGGGHRMAVWTNDAQSKVWGAIDRNEVLVRDAENVSAPAVGATDQWFLVAWGEPSGLFAQRYTLSGALLDPSPLLLARMAAGSGKLALSRRTAEAPRIGCDRSSCLIALGSAVVRLQSSLPPETFKLAVKPFFGRPLRIGDDWLLPYTAGSEISALRFSSGTIQKLPPAATAAQFNPPLAAAWAEDRLTLAWVEQGRIRLRQITESGMQTGITAGVERDSTIGVLDLAWNGTEYVLAWTERDAKRTAETLRVMRFTRDLQSIDAAPFAAVPDDVTIYSTISIVPTAEGVLLTYSKRDAENGDAPRAFARTLFR